MQFARVGRPLNVPASIVARLLTEALERDLWACRRLRELRELGEIATIVVQHRNEAQKSLPGVVFYVGVRRADGTIEREPSEGPIQ